MREFDRERTPDPQQWLALDEQLRISLVEHFHRASRIDALKVKAHGALHAIVENRIALPHAPVVRAIERLAKQGLSRHDSIHAIAWVLAQRFHEAADSPAADAVSNVGARYDAAIERLTAAGWRAQIEE